MAVRLAPPPPVGRPPTRFGMTTADVIALMDRRTVLPIAGVHFHLDGYAPGDRVMAISAALELVGALRGRGHAPSFIDIGGGIPMSYLDSHVAMGSILERAPKGARGHRTPITFENHGLD